MSAPDYGMPPALVDVEPTRRVSRPRKTTRRASARDASAETTPKPRRRTGSAATRSADNIGMHWFANVALILGAVAGAVGSIDGLLHAAAIAFNPEMQAVLPVAVDVFLVGTAVATLALRERRAWVAVGVCVAVTVALVGFSATVNFVYWQSITEPGSLAHDVGPYIKGAMPVLLLVALEILAAINTTKRRNIPASVTKLHAEATRLKREQRPRRRIAKLKAAKRAES